MANEYGNIERSGGPDGPEGRKGQSSEGLRHDDGRGQAPDSVLGRQIPVEGKKAKGFVYFIETQDGQYVKIGYSARVFSRLSQLGTLRPANFGFRLLGCMPGSHQTEAWLHDKFADLRQDGEWFRRAPALDAFIVAVGLVAPRYFPEAQQSECPLVAHESRSARRPKEGGNEPAGDLAQQEPDPSREMASRVFAMMGRRGGPARAAKLTAKRRREIAQKAARARWGASMGPK